jgi:hypothetical protein
VGPGMPSGRDNFRRNRVAPLGDSILPFASTAAKFPQPSAGKVRPETPIHGQERVRVMSVDTPRYRFHNRKEAGNPLKARQNSLEHGLEEAVSRALRDNLAPLQRTADDLQHAYADLVAACSSSRPSNALPALLRAQTSAAALAAGLSVLSNFVAVALNPREQSSSGARSQALAAATVEVEEEEAAASAPATAEPEYESEWAEEPAEMPAGTMVPEDVPLDEPSGTTEIPLEAPLAVPEVAFDVASLSPELKDLHRRANRAAKVSMQDIKLLRPKDVKLGREHKDICHRMRSELDKARKEYDRRFRAIQDHPVDYFHQWMVEILGEGDSEALGEYPYPSPVLRH